MYRDAITNLEKGLSKKEDSEAKLFLANAYMKVNDFHNATRIYEEVAVSPDLSDIDRLNFGRSLMSAERYDDARNVFEGILSRTPSNEVAQNLMLSCKNFEVLKADSSLYEVSLESIPGVNVAFSPTHFNGGILFSATSPSGAKDPYTGESYLDLYSATLENGSWKAAKKLEKINGKYHDGIATVSSDGKYMILTRSNYLGRNRLDSDVNYVNNTQLYESMLNEDGTWSEPKKLSFNDIHYMYAHPELSPDGNTLYFSSDAQGGRGGMDLYKVSKVAGEWGAPVNLGNTVNTAGDEVFPKLAGSDTLYYSSDGLTSLGGLDLVYTVNRGSWSTPTHLGDPINSSADDFGIIFNEGGDTGYLSSDRSGRDQIYGFKMFNPELLLKGLVTDVDNMNPIEGVKITVDNLTDGTQEVIITDENGVFNLDLLTGKKYKIKAEHDDYFTVTEEVSTIGKNSNEEVNVVFELEKLVVSADDKGNGNPDGNGTDTGDGKPKGDGTSKGDGSDHVYNIPNIYWDYNKWDIRADAEPYLMQLVKTLKDNPNLTVEIQSHCDSRGSDHFNDQLSKKRAKAVVDYLVLKGIPRKSLTSNGMGKRKLLNRCATGVECSEEEHQANRRTEFIVRSKK